MATQAALHDYVVRTDATRARFLKQLNPALMMEDRVVILDTIDSLIENGHQWNSMMVAWTVRTLPASTEVDVDAIFILDNHVTEKSFAVEVRGMQRVSPERVLDVVLPTFEHSQKPSWLAYMMNPKHRQVLISSFQSSFPHDAPILENFAWDPVDQRMSAQLVAHPQLDNQSAVRTFVPGTGFITNGKHLAAVSSINRNIAVEVFLLTPDDSTVSQLKAKVVETGESFADFSQSVLLALEQSLES